MSPDEVAQAVRFRVGFGLRSDEEWVRRVASDPASQAGLRDFGVPLLPFERLDLLTRPNSPETVLVVETYGAVWPDAYAGAYYDQSRGGVLVAAFTRDLERHRTALEALLEGELVEVRPAAWTLAELAGFLDEVEAKSDWFPSIGTRFFAAEIIVADNVVRVRFEGPDTKAALVEEHFGNPTWLQAESDGPLPWIGPTGRLVIEVVDDAGTPVPQVWCEIRSLDARVQLGEGPPTGSDEAGRCVFRELPAIAYRIELKTFTGAGYKTAETLEIVLEPAGTTVRAVVQP